jgi:hypothetical protein
VRFERDAGGEDRDAPFLPRRRDLTVEVDAELAAVVQVDVEQGAKGFWIGVARLPAVAAKGVLQCSLHVEVIGARFSDPAAPARGRSA